MSPPSIHLTQWWNWGLAIFRFGRSLSQPPPAISGHQAAAITTLADDLQAEPTEPPGVWGAAPPECRGSGGCSPRDSGEVRGGAAPKDFGFMCKAMPLAVAVAVALVRLPSGKSHIDVYLPHCTRRELGARSHNTKAVQAKRKSDPSKKQMFAHMRVFFGLRRVLQENCERSSCQRSGVLPRDQLCKLESHRVCHAGHSASAWQF